MEAVGDQYVCPLCKFSFTSNDPSSIINGTILKAYENAEINNDLLDYTCLKRPHPYNSYLTLLLNEARESIMIGHYLSGILTLNNYIESLAKEIIFINEGERFEGPLGPTIDYLEKKQYISPTDVERLRNIKNNIRNPYTHGNAAEVLKNIYAPLRENVTTNPTVDYLDNMIANETGELRYVSLSDMPNTAFVCTYGSIIKKQAIEMYNIVADLARYFTRDYLSKDAVKSETMSAFEKGISEKERIEAEKEGKLFKIDNGGGKAIITSPEMIDRLLR
jgi:hypothetical protein